MCEKNFEGKQLSLLPEDDTNESVITDDTDDTIVKSSKRKKRSRRKKPLKKICETCGQDILENEKREMFMYQDTYHQLRAKEYCEDHERTYTDHKCKPHWCGDCNYLVKYIVEIQTGK